MAYQAPKPSQLFEDNVAQNFATVIDTMKSVGNDSIAKTRTGDIEFVKGAGIVKSEKSRERDLLEGLVAKGALTADVVKEWDFGTPIPTTAVQYTGITPYNYEQALLMIVPKELTLRNKTTRQHLEGGQGFEYRRITSVSNSGGSSANVSGFFNSISNTATVNGITKNIPPLISYTGDTTFKPFVEFGLSDAVSLRQRFGAQGFTDADALSHLALLWADFMGEERAFLSAASTLLPIVGASATMAADSTVTGTSLPGGTPTAGYATFSSSYGESKAITLSGTPTLVATQGCKLTSLVVPTGTLPLAVNIYLNYSGTYYKGTSVLTTSGTSSPTTWATVTALPSTSADNGSYNSLGYDGAITEFNNTTLGGYQKQLNAALTSTDTFSTAAETLYITQGARPDMILTTGSIMVALWDIIQNNSSSNAYRINVSTGENGVTAGGMVNGIVNPATGDSLSIAAHRYMPAGVALIHSTQVPWADSGVTSTMKHVSAVDHLVIDWPRVDLADITSTYTFGTLVFEAPALSGIVTNINS